MINAYFINKDFKEMADLLRVKRCCLQATGRLPAGPISHYFISQPG